MTELVVTAMVTLFLAAVILFWLDYQARKATRERLKSDLDAWQQERATKRAAYAASQERARSTYRGAPADYASRSTERRRQDNDDYWTPSYDASRIHERLVPRPDPEPVLHRPDDTPGHGGAIVGDSFRTAGSDTGGGFSTGGSFGSDSSGGYTDSGSSSSSSSSD